MTDSDSELPWWCRCGMCSEEDEQAREFTCRQRGSEAGTCVEMTDMRPSSDPWYPAMAGTSGKDNILCPYWLL